MKVVVVDRDDGCCGRKRRSLLMTTTAAIINTATEAMKTRAVLVGVSRLDSSHLGKVKTGKSICSSGFFLTAFCFIPEFQSFFSQNKAVLQGNLSTRPSVISSLESISCPVCPFNKAQQANDASLGISSKLSTLSNI